ncbi:hypothetical protein SS50377_27203 [Spironucleus salmonicida]|uniref:Uncharacterized protein n=1 Tax=Spironucleus salmonicida TaxID=348837 RepID=V6M6D2_9EUKA|nr:hypothetical protein SS50377_27203 [Spironucleus salmonicida]|eukprot:EST48959.1 Hypothetical protein SS50377_10807 [Spironucleus salmonicida]
MEFEPNAFAFAEPAWLVYLAVVSGVGQLRAVEISVLVAALAGAGALAGRLLR